MAKTLTLWVAATWVGLTLLLTVCSLPSPVIDDYNTFSIATAWQHTETPHGIYPPRTSTYANPYPYMPLWPLISGGIGNNFGHTVQFYRFIELVYAVVALFGFWRCGAQLGLPPYRRWLVLAAALQPTGWTLVIGPNALALAFFAWGLYAALDRKPGSGFAAHLSLHLAFWTKQPFAVFVVAHWLVYLMDAYRTGFRPRMLEIGCMLLADLMSGCLLIVLCTSTDAWWQITYQSNHPIMWQALLTESLWREVIGLALIPWVAFCLGKRDRGPHLWIACALLLATIPRSKIGSGTMHSIAYMALVYLFAPKLPTRLSVAWALAALTLFPTDLFRGWNRRMPRDAYESITRVMAMADKPYWEQRNAITIQLGKTSETQTPSIPRNPSYPCWVDGTFDLEQHYPEELREYYETAPFDLVVLEPTRQESSHYFYRSITDDRYVVLGQLYGRTIVVKRGSKLGGGQHETQPDTLPPTDR